MEIVNESIRNNRIANYDRVEQLGREETGKKTYSTAEEESAVNQLVPAEQVDLNATWMIDRKPRLRTIPRPALSGCSAVH